VINVARKNVLQVVLINVVRKNVLQVVLINVVGKNVLINVVRKNVIIKKTYEKPCCEPCKIPNACNFPLPGQIPIVRDNNFIIEDQKNECNPCNKKNFFFHH